MKYLRLVATLLLTMVSGFFAGGGISSFFTPQNSGLAGPGIVVFYGFIGSILGLILGIGLWFKSRKSIFIGFILLALVLMLVFGIRKLI